MVFSHLAVELYTKKKTNKSNSDTKRVQQELMQQLLIEIFFILKLSEEFMRDNLSLSVSSNKKNRLNLYSIIKQH